jgi:hypothetical protein
MEIVLIRHGEPEWVRHGSGHRRPAAHRTRAPQANGWHRHCATSTSTRCSCRRSCAPARPQRRCSRRYRRRGDRSVARGDPRPDVARHPAEKAAEAYAELKGRRGRGSLARPGRRRVDRDFVTRIRAGATGFLADRGVVRSETNSRLADRRTRCPHRLVAHAGTNSVTIGHLLGLSRHRGSGTGSCSDTPRSAASRRWSWRTGTRSRCRSSATSNTSPDERTRSTQAR